MVAGGCRSQGRPKAPEDRDMPTLALVDGEHSHRAL